MVFNCNQWYTIGSFFLRDTRTHTHIRTQRATHINTYTNVSACARTHTHIHTHTHARTHTHTHTDTRGHAYTYMRVHAHTHMLKHNVAKHNDNLVRQMDCMAIVRFSTRTHARNTCNIFTTVPCQEGIYRTDNA